LNRKTSNLRFTLQFNADDPAHVQVAGILNRQGWHGKARYIVEAVMHFINCDGAQGSMQPARIDERHIEAVVRRILSDRQNDGIALDDGRASAADDASAVFSSADHIHSTPQDDLADTFPPQAQPLADTDIIYNEAAETLGEDAVNAIAGALDMFRRK
jgi:hypothetical protein